jgi:hypothetical protein
MSWGGGHLIVASPYSRPQGGVTPTCSRRTTVLLEWPIGLSTLRLAVSSDEPRPFPSRERAFLRDRECDQTGTPVRYAAA